jgi:hypothetical protein
LLLITLTPGNCDHKATLPAEPVLTTAPLYSKVVPVVVKAFELVVLVRVIEDTILFLVFTVGAVIVLADIVEELTILR